MKDQTIHNPSDAPQGQDIRFGDRGGMYYTPDHSKTPSRASGEMPEEVVERAGVSIAFFKGKGVGEYRVKVSKTAPYSQECFEKIKKEYERCGNLRQAINSIEGEY